MNTLPTCETLKLEHDGPVVHIVLHRPEVRNAMSVRMVDELESVLDTVRDSRDVRLLVLRGEGGHFCAGGDVRDIAAARRIAPHAGELDPIAAVNRRFGTMISRFDQAPQAVVAVLEGAVMGGGVGLACVSDVAIAHAEARFRLPETGLGLPPAQIAPFLVRRVGFSHSRRLAVTGGELDARSAHAIGLVHHVCETDVDLSDTLATVIKAVLRCAPEAIAITKRLVNATVSVELDALLDRAAAEFAAAARGPEGQEGMLAFVQRRPPSWSRGGDGASE